MAASATIIAALKYNGGVVIAADSQASDTVGEVRWQIEKLDCIGNYPLVVGFSGDVGMGQRARRMLEEAATQPKRTLHPNMFQKRDRIRDALDRYFMPVYQKIKECNYPPTALVPQVSLRGLVAYWAEDAPRILEYDITGTSMFHDCFHAIGSAADTAYAVYRTLGGKKLSELSEAKAIVTVLRILRTCVNVEMWGVSEPLSVWVVTQSRARRLSDDELEPHGQTLDEWEKGEQLQWCGF